MKIIVNGSEKSIEKNISVSELIKSYSLDPKSVIALKDEEVVPKESFLDVMLEDGNKIELLSIVGGG